MIPKRILYRSLLAAAAFLAVIAVAAGAFLAWRSIRAQRGQTIPVPQNTTGQTGVSSAMDQKPSNISIQLSEGSPQPQTAVPLAIATGEALAQDQIAEILARLPSLTPEPQDPSDFKLAQQPIPPPLTGKTVTQAFPATLQLAQPGPVESGPLKVLRFAPEGEVPIAPFINITFSQPMVPLATLADLSLEQVPVKLEPSLPGTWRWLGTRTLNFQYDSTLIDRLPKATVYHVTIPAGTTSASGGKLADAVEWSFSTPAPKMVFSYPSDVPQPTQPLFFVAFDQRIDAAEVLKTVQVRANNQPVSIVLVSEEKIKADAKQNWLLKNATAGRWLAFQATKPLPSDANISVLIGPGTPSAEGPLVTLQQLAYSFHTYAPLRIEDHGCYYQDNQCKPLQPFFVRFNNPIDTASYTDSMVTIEPALPGATLNVSGNTLNIQGATRGRTTYTVTVSGNIQDTFGQKLGQDARLNFVVGSSDPLLIGPGTNFVTLDPSATQPVFSIFTINYSKLNVKIFAVQPDDWKEYTQYLQDYQRTDITAKIPGRQVFNKVIAVTSTPDALNQVDISLKEYMNGHFGHFIVMIEPPTGLFQNNQNASWQKVVAWVQITQIGLDAFADPENLLVWATALKDGSPLSGIALKAGPASAAAQTATATDGTARFTLSSPGISYIVASKDDDQALLPHSTYINDEGWTPTSLSDELRWYVYDDRAMYRPGEEVHLKGWLRRIGAKQNGDVGLVGAAVNGVNYHLTDPQGNDILNGRADVNALGGFDLVLKLPQQVNLGYAQLIFNAEGSLSGLSGVQFYHGFQIQEFRRPEFEVNARNESAAPYFAGDSATIAVEAKYYAGGPLPNADVTWQVSSTPSSYSPPNWPDFTFGSWTPWWGGYLTDSFGPPSPNTAISQTFTGKTDATGMHFLHLDFDTSAGPKPVSIIAQASVMDVNRQAWTGTTTLLVHPADLYVGMRSDRYFVERGTPLKVDLILTDLDGKPVTDRPIQVRAARLEWKLRGGTWGEEEADVQTCNQGSTDKPVTCSFETPLGGSYRITASITDDQGRKNQSQITRWVSGGQQPPARKVEQEKVTLIPDQQTYQPGDVAQILVQTPFSPAEGLLTVSRSGVISTQRFHIEDGSYTLKVPIEDKYIPNLNIQVDVSGSAPRTSDSGEALANVPARPAFATGQLTLSIPPVQRTLSLQVTPAQKEISPGGETNIDVILKDAAGNPVKDAELSVVVVDEAILALTNYQLLDPLATFYTDRPSYVTSLYGRSSLILNDPQSLAQQGQVAARAENYAMDKMAGAAPMAVAAPSATMAPAASTAPSAAGSAGQPIRVRSDFNPLAVFAPAVHTDAQGHAQIAVKLPDNLTRYRILVSAVDASGRQFGTGESNLVARLPLMVRPSAPRFLNFGDAFELPVILQNQTDAPLTVQVAVQASNLQLTGNSGLSLIVPARDRVEVRFPATTIKAGTARIQIAAVSGDVSDAATVEMPVYTPATTEAFATYGVIDEGAVVQPVSAPTGVFPQYGGLQITTSSTALQALTDAVLYLVSYPYECSEQLASRVLAVASLKDVLTAFKADGLPAPAEMEAAVQRDITRLQGMQNDDGGFPYWSKGQESIPFNTIHVAHALYRASTKGFEVPGDLQQRTLEYLRQIETHYPSWYSENTRRNLSAYALYVRNLMSDRDPQKALNLIQSAKLENLSLDAIGWLWPVLQDAPGTSTQLDAIRLYVNNHAVETAGAANFTTNYDDQNYLLLGSDRRTDAILLDALIVDNPQADLIPKLVNGLLAQRTRGRWENTQENVFVLLALDHYFNTFEAQTPDFVARLWLGDAYAGETTFKGRTTDRVETHIPMAYLVDHAADGAAQNLTLSKDGTGRLYYRLGLSYAPTSLSQDALDMGFVVQRVYEAVDDPQDVTRDKDGVWHIKAGARVRIHLTMEADNRRYHVALTDPLPAGLEIVNPSLAVSGSVPQDPNSSGYKSGWWWWGTWYEHQNLRDERAEAFTSLLWDGVYPYTYIARATTPGRFVVPPSKAEEMYSPEVFGRSASDVVIVK
jgi:alpha-2-macroglobulin